LLPISNNQTADAEVPDSYGEVGGALKGRISSTELKWGEMRTSAPVFATADARLLPETATGFHISSGEIEGLNLEAGHFTAYNFRDSTNSDDSLSTNYSDAQVRSLDFVGGSYGINDDLSVMLYTSEAEDHWHQHYGNINYNIGLAEDQSLNFDFNVYRTDSTGKEFSGEISNTTWSLAAAYRIGAHRFTLAHQQVNGDTPFDYVGGDSIFLANAAQISDFNAPGMKSLQARYDLDLAAFGVPGLTFMTRYITGQGSDDVGDYSVDGANFAGGGNSTYGGYNNAKWHELDIDVRYVVQEGPAKDLSLRSRIATYRGNSEAANDYSDINEFRLIAEYPLSIL
jgi:imipenem/basic amino acid-specific outer membrane pore